MKPLHMMYAHDDITEHRKETLDIYYHFQADNTFSGTVILVNNNPWTVQCQMKGQRRRRSSTC
jgi:hypothetical protein